ncbi:diguanylate cyclase, partial [Vibrio parahaemolyticus]
GGEEFVVVLPQTSRENVAALAARAVGAVEALDLRHISSPVSARLTVSVGAAGCLPGREDRRLVLLDTADKALYAAKHAGRNCAILADE